MSSVSISTSETPVTGVAFDIDSLVIGLTGSADIFVYESGTAYLEITNGITTTDPLEISAPIPSGSSNYTIPITEAVPGVYNYTARLYIDVVEIGLIEVFSSALMVTVSGESTLKWTNKIEAAET